jgi:hypothetical protein
MIKAKLAKSRMEHEEGMNHLWIQMNDLDAQSLVDVRVIIILPQGVERLQNLNGYGEDSSGGIWLGDIVDAQELLIEIYTKNPVPCGNENIVIELFCKESKKFEYVLPLLLVTEEEMEGLVIDEEVIARLKELKASPKHDLKEADQLFVVMRPPMYVISKEMSDLEKKYRIDFRMG